MIYREFQPHPLLARFVECYWYAFARRPPFRDRERLIPDGTIELMFNFGDDYVHVREEGTRTVHGSHVIGIRKRSLVISQTNRQHFFCIRFRLGGTFPFFGVPAHLFANDFFCADELFGSAVRDLEERLYEAKSNAERVQLADAFLLRRFDGVPADHAFVSAFGRAFLRGGRSIGEVAADFGTDYKTLQRKFSSVVGLTPSELRKIRRFNHAVHSMYACAHDSLTEVAHACNYYDQSHFIREFKQLVGLAPRRFLQDQYTIVKVIQPALAERLSKSYNF